MCVCVYRYTGMYIYFSFSVRWFAALCPLDKERRSGREKEWALRHDGRKARRTSEASRGGRDGRRLVNGPWPVTDPFRQATISRNRRGVHAHVHGQLMIHLCIFGVAGDSVDAPGRFPILHFCVSMFCTFCCHDFLVMSGDTIFQGTCKHLGWLDATKCRHRMLVRTRDAASVGQQAAHRQAQPYYI